MSFSGGCQCGAVRYHVRGALEGAHLCHCRMCQKAAGNYFMPLASTAETEFAITRGEPAWFHSSDPVKRGFCQHCGTRRPGGIKLDCSGVDRATHCLRAGYPERILSKG